MKRIAQDLPDFLSLKTLKDTSNVAKQYAFIRREIREIGKVREKLKQRVMLGYEDNDDLNKAVGLRSELVVKRADLAISILTKMRKKIVSYLKTMD
jgi:hypothetical protein